MNRFGVLNLFIAIGLVATVDAIDCNTRPEKFDMSECCPMEDIITKDLAEQCKSFKDDSAAPTGAPGGGRGPGGPHGPGGRAFMPPCYSQCVMNKTGMVNMETLVVDEAKMKSYMSTALKLPDAMDIGTAAVTKCIEKLKEMRANMQKNPPPSPPPGGCKPCASMLLHCIKKEVMINCPSSVWKNDEACNNGREFLMTCKPPHGRPK